MPTLLHLIFHFKVTFNDSCVISMLKHTLSLELEHQIKEVNLPPLIQFDFRNYRSGPYRNDSNYFYCYSTKLNLCNVVFRDMYDLAHKYADCF